MHTLVVLDSVSRAGGGLWGAERGLQQALVDIGVGVSVWSLRDAHTTADLESWRPLVPRHFEVRGPVALGCSRELKRALMGEQADLIYRAGLWRMPSRYAHAWSRLKGRPEIVAPHGMLDPWAVRHSRWKKRIASMWFESAHLRDATCFRALCQSEADAIRAYGLKQPIAVIPNGVDLPVGDGVDSGQQEDRRWEIGDGGGKREEGRSDRKTVLFLGRLHPKKGLVEALRAWRARLGSGGGGRRSSEWTLVIAGWDQGGHEGGLKRLCDELGLVHAEVPAAAWVAGDWKSAASEPQVVFVGPAFGDEKDRLLRSASAFILPSFSEGLPMAVLEAWAYGLPVLMTEACNLPEGFEAGAALRIGTGVGGPESAAPDAAMPIDAGLGTLFGMSDAERRAMGLRGRRLVEDRFTWPRVAAQMKELYESLAR